MIASAFTLQDSPELLDLDQAAALLGVSKRTMEGWVRSKAVASFKRGKVRRVARADLARFVLANTIRCRRPDWLTGAVRGEFEAKIRELAALDIVPVLRRVELIERFLAEQRPAQAAVAGAAPCSAACMEERTFWFERANRAFSRFENAIERGDHEAAINGSASRPSLH